MTTVAQILDFLALGPDPCGAQSLDADVDGPAALNRAGPGTLTFCRTAGPVDAVRNSQAALALVDADVADALGQGSRIRPVIARSANARLDFVRTLAELFAPPLPEPGSHPSAVVHPDAVLGEGIHIGPGCTLGPNTEVGEGAVLHAGVHLVGNVRIGPRVIVHSGAVIGADGYGFERDEAGMLVRFPHLGSVVVDEGAEIGANACIDRGALDATWIGANARIDNLVHIAHNVQVGRDAAVIAHAMVAGSAVIGERAWIAPCACIREGVRIGDDALVGLGAVVTSDVPANATFLGNPARDLRTHRELQSRLKQLVQEP